MALRFHGCTVSVADVRRRCVLRKGGTSALVLLDVAQQLGCRVAGFAVPAALIGLVPTASILHLGTGDDDGHFVIFESSDREGVRIVDPLGGRMTIPAADFPRYFSGKVLCLRRGTVLPRLLLRAPTQLNGSKAR